MSETLPAERLAALVQDLEPYRRFAFGRLKTADLADDALQEALLRAAKHIGSVQDGQRLTAWFWTILRHAIADLITAQRAHPSNQATDPETLASITEVPTDACHCLQAAIDRLPRLHAEVLRAADLSHDDPSSVAERLGITPGALAVRRHRARAALGDALLQMCRTCAHHGCLDCTCRHP